MKSASDNLARCVEQLDAYAVAFDAPLFVKNGRLARRLERPGRERGRARPSRSGPPSGRH
jgi:predicted nuclease with RNAse H fold